MSEILAEIDRGLQPLLHLSQSFEESKPTYSTNKYFTDVVPNIEFSHPQAKAYITSLHESLSFKSPNEYTKIMESILHGDGDSPILNDIENQALKQHLSIKYPFKLYQEYLQRVNSLVQDLGFENEIELHDYLESNPLPNDSKITHIFKTMVKWTTNNKSLVLKTAVLLGLGVSFLNYLQKYNRKNSGCFRYYVGKSSDNHSLKREVYLNRFCKFNINRVDYIDYQILKDETHPLFNVHAWDCNFKIQNIIETQNILSKGCNGICNPHNFNWLVQFVDGYEPVVLENINIFYIYKCEHGTILRDVAEIAGDGIDQVIQGITQSNIGQPLINLMKNIGWIIIIIIIVMIIGPILTKLI
ncbi:hypothetical protein TCON_2080 [Astathelohania contejeani]|uniref:Heme oxygenase n=1 Tax=Astathelohania contejeani TaxID=164912 RepID=A0ABQ7HX22_9MICR|nr:hypothetical protein TCON_2080 [Thelohania contejeani]